MSIERNKASKILQELIDYFFRYKINTINVQIHYSKQETQISIEGPCAEKPADYEDLFRTLNEPRRPELEEYYYELLGGNVKHEELTLLGYLIDRADMSYQDERLSITVYRYK